MRGIVLTTEVQNNPDRFEKYGRLLVRVLFLGHLAGRCQAHFWAPRKWLAFAVVPPLTPTGYWAPKVRNTALRACVSGELRSAASSLARCPMTGRRGGAPVAMFLLELAQGTEPPNLQTSKLTPSAITTHQLRTNCLIRSRSCGLSG